jgi:hypothetical protein
MAINNKKSAIAKCGSGIMVRIVYNNCLYIKLTVLYKTCSFSPGSESSLRFLSQCKKDSVLSNISILGDATARIPNVSLDDSSLDDDTLQRR